MGERENRPPTKGEKAIANYIHGLIHGQDSRALSAWKVTKMVAVIGHFRGRCYILGGLGFHAVGTIGRA